MADETNGRVLLFAAVENKARQMESSYRDSIPCRDDLLEFLDSNDWFGAGCVPCGRDYLVSWEMLGYMDLWLRAYGKSRPEKIDLMLDAFAPVYPRTCVRYRRFIQDNEYQNDEQALRLLDFLLASIDREIDRYDEDGIRSLMDAANQELKIKGMKIFERFLNEPVDGVVISGWNYEFQSRQIVKKENGAYPLETFSLMAYTVFSEESWSENNLIDKAVEKKKYAELWLFAALHFVCALRRTDILRLPVPTLPYEPEEVRHRIKCGVYMPEEARRVTEEILIRVKYKPGKPHKTREYQKIPDLKLFIPESVMEPLGVILSLSVSFHQPGDPFVHTDAMPEDLRRFFGDEFADAAGRRKFHSRRANKSYLQGIEMSVADEPGKPKGYMLAALARSHKGGIGKLPEMTDIYLKDANFSGYSPGFVLKEMFERGVFGFIPAMLLEVYKGSDYLELDIHGQTQLIQSIGLDACQLENISDTVMKSYHRASEIVHSLVLGQCGDKSSLGSVLQRIAAGAAPAKQEECLCLMSAAGYPCPYADRTGCMGCGYEIYTKSAVYLLIKEYVRLTRKKRESGGEDDIRLKAILEKGILPALSQILSSIQMMWPDAQMEPIYQIIERGLKDADHS